MATEHNVDTLINNARHKSVKEKRLTELKGGLTARYLYDESLIEYLQADEQPHFILAARQKAPRLIINNPPDWSGTNLDGMAMHLITDRRWLIVVGLKSGDQTYEIPLEEISIDSYDTGATGHQISVCTGDNKIKIPIGNMYDSDEIEETVEYLNEFGDSESNDQKPSENNDSNRRSPRELADNARHNSVTEKLLTSTDGGIFSDYLNDKPLIEYLQEDEQPHYIFHTAIPPGFSGEQNPNWTGGKGYKNMHMVTDRRWLIVSGHQDGDRTFEIPFEKIDFIEITGSGFNSKLEIQMGDTIITLSLDDTGEMTNEMESVKEYIESKVSTEITNPKPQKTTIIDTDSSQEDNIYAKLTVPTKSSGATFTSQGWNVGGDIVRRTSSKGKVEEDAWENYVKKLVVYEDHTEIGITHGDMSITSDNTIHQHIRIDLNDISDVREEGLGAEFTFETADDVYQFKLGKKGIASRPKNSEAREAAQQIKKAVRNAPEDEPEQSGGSSDEGDSGSEPMEKLSKLKDLHDQGVLSDDEFQDKKQELLDQI